MKDKSIKLNMEELKTDIRNILMKSISSDYIDPIFEAIEKDIVKDVVECSGIGIDGYYNDDDIKFAIGRVLLFKLNFTII